MTPASGPFGTTGGPWTVGEYDDHLGYDCMTGGIGIGKHITLDAADYGQEVSWEEGDTNFDKARMMADARALGQVPAMLELVRAAIDGSNPVLLYGMARAIVAKLEEE